MSGSVHVMTEAPVSLTEAALVPETTQSRLSTPVSTMPRIGDLILSFVDKAEASVPPSETPVSLVDASPVVVSIHPVGVGAVLTKVGEPYQDCIGKRVATSGVFRV
jgi:hypothetical protein